MQQGEQTLAQRLGTTVHVSPLRTRLIRLYASDRRTNAECLEDWLVDVANARGARVVFREPPPPAIWQPPGLEEVSNEELVVALCHLQNRDRPQILRLAAQLISRQAVVWERLALLARQERVERILAEIARQALRVDPQHPLWRQIESAYRGVPPLRDSLLHWTRLAEPVMKNGRYNAERWRLVS